MYRLSQASRLVRLLVGMRVAVLASMGTISIFVVRRLRAGLGVTPGFLGRGFRLTVAGRRGVLGVFFLAMGGTFHVTKTLLHSFEHVFCRHSRAKTARFRPIYIK
jgi:hypothetical protein